ncbi:MAG: hypothetical protein V3U76_13965 [Granulosicoccus sp.]
MIRIVCLVLVSCLGGCTAFPQISASSGSNASTPLAVENDFQRSRMIALDFVETMVQLPELTPGNTTLIADRPASRFGEILLTTMQDAGYDLRMGTGQLTKRLEYTITPETTLDSQHAEGIAIYTFVVSAGSIKLKRTYRVDTLGVTPATSMFLHGSASGQLTMNASLFESLPPSTTELAHATSAVMPVVVRKSTASAMASSDNADSSVDAKIVTTAIDEKAATVRQGAVLNGKKNMYVTGRSNYQSILQQLEEVRKEVMVFPNDSLVMGRSNKKLAQQIVDSFDPGRDVISVVGCSHGPTALNNGNETLANGRSWRVKEEFMLAGIDEELVLEEGCWANTHFEKMPARGVLVTHKRRDT